ncbi:MAG: hypothetical protein A2Z48_00585 [Actinobacteria bacterium RBG_19FT_COMBO_70_19]|nr:MAG: hypothetical protein A2Z48_00585 [Actinobacteria bacterium RBG_19FT_COMBO_70_19]
MMLVHLVAGAAVVALAILASVAFFVGRPRQALSTIAGWALGLLIVQATTGMFLLTATEEGPGPLHVALPLLALAAAAVARLARPRPADGPDPLLGAVYSLAAVGALVGLITGLTAG